MKIMVLLLICTCCLVTGCSTTTTHGSSGTALTLVEPADQTIEQGDTNGVMIAVTRDNFDGPVSIRFENLPAGVSVVERDPTIPDDENVKEFMLRASPDAAVVENHQARVVARGPEGMEAVEAFEITVKRR